MLRKKLTDKLLKPVMASALLVAALPGYAGVELRFGSGDSQSSYPMEWDAASCSYRLKNFTPGTLLSDGRVHSDNGLEWVASNGKVANIAATSSLKLTNGGTPFSFAGGNTYNLEVFTTGNRPNATPVGMRVLTGTDTGTWTGYRVMLDRGSLTMKWVENDPDNKGFSYYEADLTVNYDMDIDIQPYDTELQQDWGWAGGSEPYLLSQATPEGGVLLERGGAPLRMLARQPMTLRIYTEGSKKNSDPVKFEARPYVKSVAGMPFYPAGITNETDFAALDPEQQFFYLGGHNINAGSLSPEWQLAEAGSGVYTLDFTYNEHTAEAGCPAPAEERNNLTIYAFRPGDAEPQALASTAVQGAAPGGVRMRATYNAADNSLSLSQLSSTLPFISLVGEDWVQQNALDRGLTLYGEEGREPSGMVSSWIQYDALGNPLLARNGRNVFLNTQWPPLNPVFFNTRITLDSGTYDMAFNSRQLTFAHTGRGTGAALEQAYGFSFSGDEAEQMRSAEYEVYSAENLWASGRFRLWSGWNGARDAAGNPELGMNLNWGHATEQDTPVDVTSTPLIYLADSGSDMLFSRPTYLRNVYFFLPAEGEQARPFIWFRKAPGNLRIQALSNAEGSAGQFAPTIDADLEGYTIREITLDLHRSSNDAHISNLWTRQSLSLTPAEFNQFFGRAADGKFEPGDVQGYFADAFSYQTSGNYYYNMTVEFAGPDGESLTEQVRSNTFYVTTSASSLFAAQLVEVAEGDEQYGRFRYITWTPGATEEFGYLTEEAYADKKANPVTGSDRWGNRVEKIAKPDAGDFYQNSDRATWTDNILLYARRPWVGETPDQALAESNPVGKYWKLWYEGKKNSADEQVESTLVYVGKKPGTKTDELTFSQTATGVFVYDGPLELIFKATDIYAHDYRVTLYYEANGQAFETPNPGEADVVVRIPTPRMLPGVYTGKVGYLDEESVTIAAENYTGNVREGEFEEQTYAAPRVRHLHFTAYMDMPNATPGLLSLIPDTDGPGISWRETRFEGDPHLCDMLDNTRLNLKSQEPTSFELIDQDINMWLTWDEAAGKYIPVDRNLTFDFVRAGENENGLIQFYPRRAHGVTLRVTPHFDTPRLDTDKVHVYAYKYLVGENDYNERLVLAALPVTPCAESYLEVPGDSEGNMNRVMLDVDPEKAYYVYRIDDTAARPNVLDSSLGNIPASALQHHSHITNFAQVVHQVDDQHHGPYWHGLADFSAVKNEFDVEVAHAYIFRVNRAVECTGAVQPIPSPARTISPDEYADGAHYMAFVTPGAKEHIVLDEIPTSVQEIEAQGISIIVGEGFIDLRGNEAAVFSTDGRLLFQGNGLFATPAGIYLVKTSAETLKVIVK